MSFKEGGSRSLEREPSLDEKSVLAIGIDGETLLSFDESQTGHILRASRLLASENKVLAHDCLL